MIHLELKKKFGDVTNVRVEKGNVKFTSNRSEWKINNRPKHKPTISIPLNQLIEK